MIGPVKRLVVAALAVALLAGCARPSPAGPAEGPAARPAARPGVPSTAPTRTPPSTCPAEGVRLSSGQTDGALGLRGLGITLVNCGHDTYRVDGYPVVRALDEDHRQLTVKVLHGTKEIAGPIEQWDGPPTPVALRPGQVAECVIVWRNTYADIRKPPANPPYLQIAPAPGRPLQLVTLDSPMDLGSTGRLGVSPWRVFTDPAPTTPAAPPPVTTPPPSLPPPLLQLA